MPGSFGFYSGYLKYDTETLCLLEILQRMLMLLLQQAIMLVKFRQEVGIVISMLGSVLCVHLQRSAWDLGRGSLAQFFEVLVCHLDLFHAYTGLG